MDKVRLMRILEKSPLFFFIFILLLGVIWFGYARYEYRQKEKRAKAFVDQIVQSVLADTEFYKIKSESDVIEKVLESRNSLSNSYVVLTRDYSWGIYEGTILFDNSIRIEFDVTFQNKHPYMLIYWNQKINN